MADLSETIENAASEPAAVSVDGQSATAQPIDAIVKADTYVANKAALSSRRSGWRAVRQAAVRPQGSV